MLDIDKKFELIAAVDLVQEKNFKNEMQILFGRNPVR